MRPEPSKQTESPRYEPPSLRVLGRVSELTQGPHHGAGPDGLGFWHPLQLSAT